MSRELLMMFKASKLGMNKGAVLFGVTMGADIGFNLFREFWPGTKRHRR
jgi:hypothetical protein